MNRVLKTLAASVLLHAVSSWSVAEADTITVGRAVDDCGANPCNIFDLTPGAANGGGINIAMLNAGPGDTVLVFPGSIAGGYNSPFTIPSGVVLLSAAGADSTFICGSSGFVAAITLVNSSPETTVDGFTIRHNSLDGFGGGVQALAASGTIRNCVFRECEAASGSGVYANNSDIIVENNLFLDNSTISGGGTVALTGSAATVRNNTFVNSSAPFGTGGAVLFAAGSPYVFDKNIVLGSVGAPAVFCSGDNNPTITCNLFWDNEFGPFTGTCVDSTGTSGNMLGDPLFCTPTATSINTCNVAAFVDLRADFGTYHYGTCSDSPALTSACGVIGFTSPLGTCGPCLSPTPVSTNVDVATWGRIKAGYSGSGGVQELRKAPKPSWVPPGAVAIGRPYGG